MNDYNKEYNAKLTTPEEAVKVIKSGDWVDYGCLHAYPALLDRALADRKEELEDVKVRSLLMHGPLHIVEEDPNQEHFTYNSWHMVKFERNLCDRGLCYFIPMLFRNLPGYYRRFLDVDVAMMAVTPMENTSGSDGYPGAVRCGGIPAMRPRTCSGRNCAPLPAASWRRFGTPHPPPAPAP